MRKILIFVSVMIILMIFTGCEESSTNGNTNPGVPVLPVPSIGKTGVGNVTQLGWSCEDADGDALTYTVYMGKTEELSVVASDISENYFVPDTLDYSQRYYWKVRANDGKSTTSSSRWWFKTVEENVPPTVPASPVPADSLIDTSVNQLFRWYCYDINGDAISFDFCLGKDENPPVYASDLTDYQFTIDNLDYHTRYYWQVIAKSAGMVTEGPVWTFETRYYNYPPSVPHTPFPQNGSESVSTASRISWNCSDPENDALQYDIYFSTDSNPQLVMQGATSTTYFPQNLEPLTTYYWRIDAWDGNNYSNGPIWSFTTGDPNNPPNAPYMPWPSNGATGESIHAMLRWTCSDPDGDPLMYKVYFSVVPNLNEDHVIAIGITEQNWELATLTYGTTYYWKVMAHDGELSATSETWSFTTETFNP
jgi:hypothetical protein